jgi:flagellin-like protein
VPDRAISPVLGIVLLLVVTVALAGTVGTAAFGTTLPSDSPRAAIGLQIDADANRLTFLHRGGDVLVASELSVQVRVDGAPLDVQPPVPFFSASGFRPGPTGPFNAADDGEWTAGETASFRIAGTNDPLISDESTVEVVVSVDGALVAEIEETA